MERLEHSGKTLQVQRLLHLSTIVFRSLRRCRRDFGWWTVETWQTRRKWPPNYIGRLYMYHLWLSNRNTVLFPVNNITITTVLRFRFVVFAKRTEINEARIRLFCMTDDREDKTLEHKEQFTEVSNSRDVEVCFYKL